ncbi:hypothetical protein MsAg5_04560 [Methanosarcinaceae archaeon Ag5]|uniref:Uncharacterized protein n=1 Tax=Methanolapillus africanus TaxID=3028297 RepID=A0AAE4MHA9_9EURY|nr:hypothetical protein [Methanosarcinaceae archaeon Ag5]
MIAFQKTTPQICESAAGHGAALRGVENVYTSFLLESVTFRQTKNKPIFTAFKTTFDKKHAVTTLLNIGPIRTSGQPAAIIAHTRPRTQVI